MQSSAVWTARSLTRCRRWFIAARPVQSWVVTNRNTIFTLHLQWDDWKCVTGKSGTVKHAGVENAGPIYRVVNAGQSSMESLFVNKCAKANVRMHRRMIDVRYSDTVAQAAFWTVYAWLLLIAAIVVNSTIRQALVQLQRLLNILDSRILQDWAYISNTRCSIQCRFPIFQSCIFLSRIFSVPPIVTKSCRVPNSSCMTERY